MANWEMVEITFDVPEAEEMTLDRLPALQSQCGEAATYAMTNGAQFFAELPDDTTQFVFLRIGQGFVVGSGLPGEDWYSSIRIVQ